MLPEKKASHDCKEAVRPCCCYTQYILSSLKSWKCTTTSGITREGEAIHRILTMAVTECDDHLCSVPLRERVSPLHSATCLWMFLFEMVEGAVLLEITDSTSGWEV